MANDEIKVPCQNCPDGILIFDFYVERVNSKFAFYRISGDAVCDKCDRREIITGGNAIIVHIKRKGESSA
jgi:hypothetical protein